MKVCKKCNLKKDVINFFKRKAAKDGLTPECKKCCKEYKKQYFNNPEKIKKMQEYFKEYGKKNKERKRIYFSEYREKNRESIRINTKNYLEKNKEYNKEWHANYRKRKLKDDLNYKLRKNLRRRLHNALKGNFKAGSAVRDLGCSIEEFRTYLEAKFQPGMSWENWSQKGWHIDHIKPLSSFNLTSPAELKIACHYTNLQPLWAQDNLSKWAKV